MIIIIHTTTIAPVKQYLIIESALAEEKGRERRAKIGPISWARVTCTPRTPWIYVKGSCRKGALNNSKKPAIMPILEKIFLKFLSRRFLRKKKGTRISAIGFVKIAKDMKIDSGIKLSLS